MEREIASLEQPIINRMEENLQRENNEQNKGEKRKLFQS